MRTLLLLAGEPIGVTDEILKVGDIIRIGSEDEDPVIVRDVNDMPQAFDGTPLYSIPANKIAYLHIDEKIAKKYTQKKRSASFEKSMARNLKGRATPGSGAIAGHKGDVDLKSWKGEHKFTDAKKYRLTMNVWNKIRNEALDVSTRPLMEIVLNAQNNPLKIIVADENDFMDVAKCTQEEIKASFIKKEFTTTANSIVLDEQEIRKHLEDVEYNYDKACMALFVLNLPKKKLYALEINSFMEIFND